MFHRRGSVYKLSKAVCHDKHLTGLYYKSNFTLKQVGQQLVVNYKAVFHGCWLEQASCFRKGLKCTYLLNCLNNILFMHYHSFTNVYLFQWINIVILLDILAIHNC